MTTATELLTRGYFPRELPPPFSTEQFGVFISVPAQRATLPNQRDWTRCVLHNLARPGSLRRPLKIPNPVHHLPLAEEIAGQWAALVAQCRLSALSASAPIVRRTLLDRAVVPRLTHRALSRLRARRFAGKRYFLRTDISQFYPSIYTHSIPWALHGKAYAKANMNATPGDRIDRGLRNQQDGQTVGIPIGPDCSLVVAELILSAVDVALANHRLQGLRYVDDYELGFRTLSEAETILTELQGRLAEYELYLNPRKTRIIEGPIPMDESWALDLGRFVFRGKTSRGDVNDAIAFFSRAFELAKEHPTHAVLRYAMVTAQRWQFPTSGWPTFEALLFNSITADPGTLPVGVVLLWNHVVLGRSVTKTLAQRVLEAVITRHAPLGHGSEVAWAIWLAIQFDVRLSTEAASSVGAMEDDIVALLALDAESRHIFPANALDTTKWTQILALPGVLNDEHWLLAYEANRKAWLQCAAVAQHPFFSVLDAAQVSFYDLTKRLTSFTGAAAPIPGGALGAGYA